MVSTTSEPSSRRKYDNSRRRADAEARQRRIVVAATDLFLEQGFGATSIDQIADAADVSAPTVYAIFGSKAGVLARAIDVAVAGDYDDTPVIDRALTFVDKFGNQPLQQSAAVAHFIRTANERVAPLDRVMEQAASTDPAIQEMRTGLMAAIRADCTKAVEQSWRTALRPGMPESEAADVMAMMLSPFVFSMLTADLGWSPERYQRWIADALPKLLFDDQNPDSTGR